MLGVGSSISSVVENKYNISLNGTSDYINIDSFTQHADLANGMAWSLAVWFKGNGNATSGAHTNMLFSAHSSDASNRLRIGIDADGTKGVYYADAQADQGGIGDVDLDDGNWHLVVISRPSGLDQQVTVYIDGATAGTVANTEVLWDNDLAFASIGQEYDPAGGGTSIATDFFGGEIAQLAFWKTELLRYDVTSIYSAGRNADLNTPQTEYQEHAEIIGYWKMGDGSFDDRVNGVIQNQANPGFGSELLINNSFDELGNELITNGDFSTSGDVTTSSFSLGWKISASDNLGVSIVNNQLLLSRPVGENTDYGRAYATNGVNSINVKPSDHSGKVFKLEFEIVAKTGTPTLRWYNNGYITFSDTTLGKKTIYFTSSTNRLVVFLQEHEGSSITLDNISLKEVDPNGKWTLGADWSIEDGELKANTPGGTVATAQVVDGFTAGKTYKLSFDVPTVTQGFFRAYAYVGSSGTFTKILQTPNRETGRYETIFEFGGSDKTFRFYGSPSGGDLAIGSINNASLKQINDTAGIVTGATFVADN